MATRHDVDSWMWMQACDLVEQAERLRRQFFRLTGSERTPTWEPPVDVFEDDREVVIVVGGAHSAANIGGVLVNGRAGGEL